MKRAAVIVLTLGLFTSLSSYAQKRILTFNEAIKIAMQKSYMLNQEKNNLELAQMRRTQALAAFGPTLTASGTAQQTNGNFFNQNEGRVINGVTDRVSGSVSAGMTLFNGLGQVNSARSAISSLEAQSYYVNRTAQDVINGIANQYLVVLLNTELLKIAQENFTVLNKQLEQVKAQVELGAKSPVDQYNQDSQTKAAEIKALQAEIDLINSKGLLTQILLMDPTEEFDVVKPNWDVNSTGDDVAELNSLIELGLKSRGDYLRVKKLEDATKFLTKATWASMTPTISAFGVIGSGYNNSHGDATTRPFSTQFKTDNLFKNYGVQIYIPILGGNQVLQNRTLHFQAKVNNRNAQQLSKNIETQVKTDVLRNYQNFKLYRKTFVVSIEQEKAAEIAFGYEKERYELGVTNFVDFITANKNHVQAQTDKAQAEVRLLFQKVLMDYATGTLKPEDLEQ